MKFFKFSFLILLTATMVVSCGKEYSSEQLIPATGAWEFTNGNTRYSGYLDNVYKTSGIGSNVLYIVGKTDNGRQSFQLKLYADSFPTGSYYASQFENSFLYSLPSQTIYQGGQTIGEFEVDLTRLDSTRIAGTFSGTARDSTSNLIQITNGKFSTY